MGTVEGLGALERMRAADAPVDLSEACLVEAARAMAPLAVDIAAVVG